VGIGTTAAAPAISYDSAKASRLKRNDTEMSKATELPKSNCRVWEEPSQLQQLSKTDKPGPSIGVVTGKDGAYYVTGDGSRTIWRVSYTAK
jgi:hypothetical protein